MAKVFVEGDHEALDRIAAALRSAGLSTDDIQFVVRSREVTELPANPGNWAAFADLAPDLSYADWRDEEQEVGFGGQGPGDGHPLAHAAGELLGEPVGEDHQVHDGQQLLDPLGPPGLRDPLALQAEGDVLGHRLPGVERIPLEH